MKKLIPFLALTVLATGAYAQGVITFANNVLAPTPYVMDAPGEQRLTGTSIRCAVVLRCIRKQSGGTHGGAESLPCGWIQFGRNLEHDNRCQPNA
jgi:hypothetical protein